MGQPAALISAAIRRDKRTCNACGLATRPVLAVHHVIPIELGGRDALSNLLTLCANCHRAVHWLATGDRSLHSHAFGLGANLRARRRLIALARRIRSRRNRVVRADRTLLGALPLSSALDAVVERNGVGHTEAAMLRRCFRRAWNAIRPVDRRVCSLRLSRHGRFVSVNANNHLAVRVPAWTDDGYRDEADIVLIWPEAVSPISMSSQQFRKARADRSFRLIPCVNLWLTWDECLGFGSEDWRVFSSAVHDGLTRARTGRRTSNVVPD